MKNEFKITIIVEHPITDPAIFIKKEIETNCTDKDFLMMEIERAASQSIDILKKTQETKKP